MLNCIDNSGAAVVECINVLRRKSAATLGTTICCSSSTFSRTRCARMTQRQARSHLTYFTGDRIVIVVQKQRNFGPEANHGGGSSTVSAANKVRRGDIRHAVIVRTAKEVQRSDGSVVKFDDNACVLINKAGEPLGSRIGGVVAQEVRKRGWSKILSMAPTHI